MLKQVVMKFFACIIAILFFQLKKTDAQQSSIHGVVSVFNSETEKGIRKYISLAQVKDDFDKANPTTTDVSGSFQLVFVGIQDKETVSFSVKKTGWQVVNIDALTAITGQRDAVKISMASPDKIASYRKQIYNIGLTEAEKPLNELLQKQNRELADLQKDSTLNREKIKQLKIALADTEAKRKKLDGQAMELARKYAPINLDDASPLFRDAFNLFTKGELDSALIILTKVDLANQVYEILEERKKLKALQQEINERDSVQKQRTDDVEEALEFKADLHKTRNELDSTSSCYQLLLQLDSSNIRYQFEYASFLQWLNQYDKALAMYAEILYSLSSDTVYNQKDAAYYEASVQNKLGNIYFDKNAFTKAETAYKNALQIREKLAVNNSQSYLADLAQTLNNLGNLYLEKKEFNKADSFFRESIKIRKSLAEDDEENVKRALGESLNNLGNLYYKTNNFSKADSAYHAALDIRQHLTKYHDKNLNQPDVAETEINLGALYYKENDFNNADAVLKKAYDIYKRLTADNPQTYLPYIATVQNNRGNLYCDKNNFDKAEQAYKESLSIRKKLAEDDPEIFEADLANTYYNMAIFYTKRNDYANAKLNYEASYAIRKKLAAFDCSTFGSNFSVTCNNLGKIYLQLKDFAKAENVLIESLTTLEKLMNDSSNNCIKDASLTGILLLSTYAALVNTAGTDTGKQILQQKQVSVEQKLNNWAIKDSDAAKNYAVYYGGIAKYFLFFLKFKEAEQFTRKGLSVDSSLNDLKVILAPALLFQNKYDEAAKIYLQLKFLKDASGKSYAELCLQDLDTLQRKGAVNADVEKIRNLLRK